MSRRPTALSDEVAEVSTGTVIERLVARGAAEHAGIAEPKGLRALLAGRLAEGGTDLDTRAADLYLAAACVAGDGEAITRVDAGLPATIRPALARIGVPSTDDDEIVQRVRVALLVRDEAGKCGLAGYTGRGELRSYLRSVAVRIALKRLEREVAPGKAESEVSVWLPDASDSPELALLKQRCREGLRVAFAAALAGLTARERTLLRQHYVDGLTVDMLAALHHAHRSTCARWIEAARVKILRSVRTRLRGQLDLDAGGLEDAIELVRSRLDLSLSRHLASHHG